MHQAAAPDVFSSHLMRFSRGCFQPMGVSAIGAFQPLDVFSSWIQSSDAFEICVLHFIFGFLLWRSLVGHIGWRFYALVDEVDQIVHSRYQTYDEEMLLICFFGRAVSLIY
jgi:hypothetical protein